MTLNEVKEEIDKLVMEGYGDYEFIHVRGSYLTYFEDIMVNDDDEEVVIY